MTSATIKEKILEDMKIAMRSHEKDRLSAIRLILAALKQREVDERIILSDEQIIVTLNKMIKQRRDSITQYEAGKRMDLAQKEAEEIRIIQHYLPAQLSETEVILAVTAAIQESGATSVKDIGKVMALLKSRLQGKADMAIVSNKVKQQLAT
jgi:uncharacterized protein YqeY